MGDMAAVALDQTMDAEDDRFLYRTGGMSDATAYELGIVDELGGYDHPSMFLTVRSSIPRVCKYCNATNLHWVNFPGGWRLAMANGTVHSCDEYQSSSG